MLGFENRTHSGSLRLDKKLLQLWSVPIMIEMHMILMFSFSGADRDDWRSKLIYKVIIPNRPATHQVTSSDDIPGVAYASLWTKERKDWGPASIARVDIVGVRLCLFGRPEIELTGARCRKNPCSPSPGAGRSAIYVQSLTHESRPSASHACGGRS